MGPSWSTDEADVVVLAGGDPVDPALLPAVPADAWLIAADGGLALAGAVGRSPDLVVGDLDSADPAALERARRAGAQVQDHPRDKDRTDLAIALDAALERAPARLLVLGGHAGRLDHLLGNALLLCSQRYAPLEIVARVGPATATVVHDRARLTGRIGEVVSLLPVHGPAGGVRTEGLRWPLEDEQLTAGSSRGLSNELVATRAEVRVASGTLLALQPGTGRSAPAGEGAGQ